MPRLIFKCPYLSPNASADRGGYAVYVATRDGVVIIPREKRGLPATLKQRDLVLQLLSDFPDMEESFEYEDYIANPTMGNASEFISRGLEDNYHAAKDREGYVSYISERPRVSRVGEHGLFGSRDGPVVLSKVADEIKNHPGNVWTPIISLRREDAARLRYDNIGSWQALLRSNMNNFAKHLRIDADDFVWYAAFHDEGHHPHIHMLCYSKRPSKGFLTVDGIRGIKSALMKDIFRHDLEEIYQRQTLHRTGVGAAAQDALHGMIQQMGGGVLDSEPIMEKLVELTERLRFHSGKMVYGYLRPPVKAIVDSIVDELQQEPCVTAAYDKWCEARQEVIASYKDAPEPVKPLSQNKEFKAVRNMVVKEAVQLMRGDFTMEHTSALELAEPDTSLPEQDMADAVSDDSTTADGGFSGDDFPEQLEADAEEHLPERSPVAETDEGPPQPYVMWTERYKWGLGFLYGAKTEPPSYDDAYEVLLEEAGAGNALAMHDIGRMFDKGLGREVDSDAAQEWYEKALAGFIASEPTAPIKSTKEDPGAPKKYVQYRIGKMYNAGLGTQQNPAEAASWFRLSAQQEYKYAQYSLGCLYRDGKGVPQDHAEAFHLFSYAAEQDFPYASFECGKMLRDGLGTDRDMQKADTAFREAFAGFHSLESDRPDDNLQYRLGWMLLTGTGTEVDRTKATEYFEKAAKQNNVYAQYQLAKLLLEEGDLDAARFDEAVGWMLKAAEAGLDTAQYALGKLYLFDERVKDIPATLHWLTLAATPSEKNPAGNSYAQFQLGKLCLAGTEVKMDVEAGLGWLEMSAMQGNQFAQYAFGMALLRGAHGEPDASAAVPWLLKAGEQGNEYAAYQLGKLYLAGELVEKNTGEGLRWMLMAAEADNQYAQYALGKFYLFGDEELRDEQAAVHWLTLSAQQGNIYAAFLLEQREQWRRGAVLMAGTRLLGGVGQIFSTVPPHPLIGASPIQLDRKRRRELQQKGGKGIQQPDQEQMQGMAH